jgi:hypothetical protein
MQPVPPTEARTNPSKPEFGIPEDAEPGLPAEAVEGDFDFILRLVGVSPEDKENLERDIRALPDVESVQPVYYRGGELALGLQYAGSFRALRSELQLVTQFRVKRFLIEVTGGGEETSSIKVRIFAPAEGTRLALTTVFVGVEVEGADNPTVTVNGIPAEPLPSPGRYRARILCEPGRNEIIAVARDAKGGSGRAKTHVLVTQEGGTVEDTPLTVLIQGKVADPQSTVTVDGRPVKVQGDGTYRVEVPLRDGQKFVVVVTLDSLGNKSVRKIPVSGK